MKRARSVAVACGLLLSVVACTSSAGGPIAPPPGPIAWPYWKTLETVRAVAVGDDGTVYVGGTFTRIGPMTGAGVPVSGDLGVSAAAFPKVDGLVTAAVADGAGGWYVGGEFTRVGGAARENLAHVLADGTLDPAWTPSARSTDPASAARINALAFDGTTLYVAGAFDTLGEQPRHGLGAVDAAGVATAWAPDVDWNVYAIALRGPTVYVGGLFTAVNGEGRLSLAALDAAGALTAWNPGAESVTRPGSVTALAVAGDAVIVAGSFDHLAGEPRNGLAAVDAATGVATAWNPVLAGDYQVANELAVDGNTLYVGGAFDSVDGQPRSGVAAFDASGALTSWAPSLGGFAYVTALAASGGTVYVGGEFDRAGGLVRSRLAAFDASGAPTAWDPDLDDEGAALTLAPGGGAVYVGGGFKWIGKATKRAGLAAIDPAGQVTPWNPGVAGDDTTTRFGFGGAVHALAVVGGTVYVGGEFSQVGGAARRNLAAVDAAGSVTSFSADVDGPVYALAPGRELLNVGGRFTTVGGVSRANLAALDASGTISTWDPSPNAPVTALAPSGSTIYVGGYFTGIAGEARTALAAFDVGGALRAWNPHASGGLGWAGPPDASPPPTGVGAIAVDGDTVYVAGDFERFGSTSRPQLAALDAASGAPLPFGVFGLGTSRSWRIYALGLVPGSVVAGGTFDLIHLDGRFGIPSVVLVDAASTESSSAVVVPPPNALPEDMLYDQPHADAIAVRNGTIYVGGRFWGWPADWRRWNLAALDENGMLLPWDPNAYP